MCTTVLVFWSLNYILFIGLKFFGEGPPEVDPLTFFFPFFEKIICTVFNVFFFWLLFFAVLHEQELVESLCKHLRVVGGEDVVDQARPPLHKDARVRVA